MSVSELDRWRTAHYLIKLYKSEAELDAAQRADEALAHGDVEAFHFWQDIARRVRELQADKPPSGVVH